MRVGLPGGLDPGPEPKPEAEAEADDCELSRSIFLRFWPIVAEELVKLLVVVVLVVVDGAFSIDLEGFCMLEAGDDDIEGAIAPGFAAIIE